MSEPLFIETIRVENGTFIRPEMHLYRMHRTICEIFGSDLAFGLPDELIPADRREGVIKCRIVYGKAIEELTFIPYTPRQIHSLQLIEANENIDYHLKYEDRAPLIRLLERRNGCDEILIIRNGAITDTSYSNVAFFDGRKYVTPDTFLLNGTRRQHLLQAGLITEMRITPADLPRFKRVVLLNAMLGLEENLSVPTGRIQGVFESR